MLMRLGRPQDALSRFDSALNAKPSTTAGSDGRIALLDAGLGAVQAMLALQRPQDALVRAKALLAQFPNEPEVKLWHGSALEALERYDEAETAYRETMDKAPKLFSGYVALSQLLFKRGRPEEAARVLSLASGLVEDSAEVRRMLGNSELVRSHIPEAVHQFEAALHFDPHDPGALFGLATAQRKSGAIDAAAATIDKLEKADPTFPGLALERGQILENRGEYVAAIEAYRKALAQRPNDSELKLRLGAALVTAGQVDEAENVLNQVLKERPTSAEAEHYLGRVLFARKETAQAAQRFERAVNFDTLKADYHLYLAWALLEQGNFGGALESVQRAIERDPNLGDARWILGRIQLRTGAVKDALVNFQAALRLKPGRVEALAAMGDAYDELRDYDQAIKSYRDALKRTPDNAEWWYRLGQLHLDKGHRDDARVALAEAVMRGDRLRDRPSWLAEAHRSYGDVLRESKRGAEAADHYRLFLELAPRGHPDRAEVEQLLYRTRR
jgi:tetratricopeptide (TPR) repeat protein